MAGMFDEIIGMEQRRSHGEYALDGIAPNTVAELEEAMNAAERADMIGASLTEAKTYKKGQKIQVWVASENRYVPAVVLADTGSSVQAELTGKVPVGWAKSGAIMKGIIKEHVEPLEEGLSLGKGDLKVIDAFLDKASASSKKLDTDGARLDGSWMGGRGIARWVGGKIQFADFGSKAAQTVQRAVKKKAPKNWLAEARPVARGYPHKGYAVPSPLLGGRGEEDYALEIIRGMQKADKRVKTKGTVARHGMYGQPDGGVVFTVGDVYGSIRVEQSPGGGLRVSAYTTGRNPTSFLFPSNIPLKKVADSALPKTLIKRMKQDKAFVVWDREGNVVQEDVQFGLLNERGEYVGHVFKDGKDFYVDTAFVQLASNKASQVLPGFTLRHMGFGEFSMEGPGGASIEFDRMRGRDFPGQSGRSHKLYGDKKAVQKLVKNMVNKGHAQMSKKFKAPTPKAVAKRTGMKVRAKTRGALQQKLYDYFMDVYDQEGRQRPWRSVHSIAAAVKQKYSGPQFEKLLKSLDAMVKSGLLDKSPAQSGTPGKDDQYRLAEWAPARPIQGADPDEVELPAADLAVLNAISEAEGGVLSAPKIAEATGLPKSDVRTMLDAMARENVVARTHPAGDVWRITHFGEACKAHGKKRKKTKRGMREGLEEGRMPSTSDTPGLPQDRKEAKKRMKKILQIASKSVSKEALAKADWIERFLMDEFFTATKAWRKGTYSHKTADELDKYFAQRIVAALSRTEGREPLAEKAYDVKTKPALRKVEKAAMALYKGKGTLAGLKAAVDAAAKSGASKNELVDAVGGSKAWNGFVRELKSQGLTEEKGSYKAQGPLEKMIGEMVRGQSGKWLSKSQMKAIVNTLAKKGITKPTKDSYDDIARVVGKTLASMMKGESTEPLSEGKVMGFDVVNIDVGPTTTNAEMINAITSNIKARKAVKLGRWVMAPPGRVFKLSEKYRGSGVKVPGAKEIEDAEVAIYGIPNFLKAWHKDW